MKEVRPTSGRVLLALFNILGSMSVAAQGSAGDFSFLDLFAGTGRVGFEAKKRGATSVFFVETLKDRAHAIERSARSPGMTVLNLELRRALTWLIRRGCRFDVVFADPPYGERWGASLLGVAELRGVLKKNGVLVVEHATREPLNLEDWERLDARPYGETTLTFLKRPAAEIEEEKP